MPRVVVVGDAMLDETWTGVVRGDPRDTTPVITGSGRVFTAGGAARVANAVFALGGDAVLIATIGDDEAGDVLRAQVHADARWVTVAGRPTTRKVRVVDGGGERLRFDWESTDPLPADAIAALNVALDLVPGGVAVLSDYGKGVAAAVGARVVADWRAIVDPRGDLHRYDRAAVLTPNRAQVVDPHALLTRGAALVVKDGPLGFVRLIAGAEPRRYAPLAIGTTDPIGAGDVLCAAIAIGLAGDRPLDEALVAANVAVTAWCARLGP